MCRIYATIRLHYVLRYSGAPDECLRNDIIGI
jgi:hypothetical protein